MTEWKMVPVEPTAAMIQAGLDAYGNRLHGMSNAYRAMVSAAPAAPEAPSDAVVERLRAWDDMITNCAGVPQNPDSLPMMLRHEIRTMIAALRPDGQTGGK